MGLLYVFIIPPGQHYDEPGHLDYAWLAANRPAWPETGDYDQYMRREQLGMLAETDFFTVNRLTAPDLVLTTIPLWSGVSQVVDPPLYHFLVSLPLRVLRYTDLRVQLYTGRLVSWVFYMLAIYAAWKLTQELTPAGHPLRWMVPFSLAALPAFSDLMTALNNDSPAIAFFSLWLLAAVRVIRRGFFGSQLILLVAVTVACFLTKKTVWVAIPFLALVGIFTMLKRKPLYWIALLLAGLGIITGMLMLTGGDAAFWIRGTGQNLPTRKTNLETPIASNAIQLEISPGDGWPKLYQLLPDIDLEQLRGKVVTVGAWVWASQDASVHLPGLAWLDNQLIIQETAQTQKVSTQPQFFYSQYQIPEDAARLHLLLTPKLAPDIPSAVVYYTGVTLVDSAVPADAGQPLLTNGGRRVEWGGMELNNLSRNAFLVQSWPRFRPEVINTIFSRLGLDVFSLSNLLAGFMDPAGAGWYFRISATYIFNSFWAAFGWGYVPGFFQRISPFLAVMTAISYTVLIISSLRKSRSQPISHPAIFLLLVSLFVWGTALCSNLLLDSLVTRTYIPLARYAYPVIVPTLIGLWSGYLIIFQELTSRFKLPTWLGSPVFITGFILLDLFSILSIVRFLKIA